MSEIVCNCFDKTEEDIRTAIRDKKLTSVDEVSEETDAGCGCGACCKRIQEILEDERKAVEA